jgi:nicotinamide riboside kinase
MRIAIDGAQSTGKTTLWTDLKKQMAEPLIFIPEIGSLIGKNDYGIQSSKDWVGLLKNHDRCKKFIDNVIAYQLQQEDIMFFIVDSSLYRVSTLAYLTNNSVSEIEMAKYKYDLIFYCPIEFEYVEDRFRTPYLRVESDQFLRNTIQKFHKGNLVEMSGTREERLATALEHITLTGMSFYL